MPVQGSREALCEACSCASCSKDNVSSTSRGKCNVAFYLWVSKGHGELFGTPLL